MAWNPETYNKFKSERFLPFFDLTKSIIVKPDLKVIDLGCGTGEMAGALADLLPGSTVTGIDASAEMLSKAAEFKNEAVNFKQLKIEEQLDLPEKFDLIFSNAAIQWIENHKDLLPKIISKLNPGGQLHIQIPAQASNISNQLLDQLADKTPYNKLLQNWKRDSAVLDINDYSKLLFENGGHQLNVYEKVYPLILENPEALFDWVSGTALIPYLAKLPAEQKEQFIADYKKELAAAFPVQPVFYPFRRILMSAIF